jgi:hypothetical protein
VQLAGALVNLDATAAPVADVLDRLAAQTGIKVVYEGPKPRAPVTLKLRGRSPAETVLAVLEGLGVNFALVADPTGAGGQTLMVAAATPGAPLAKPEPARRPRPALPAFLTRAEDSSADDQDPALEDPVPPIPEPQGAPSGPDGTATPAPGATDGPAAAPSPKPGLPFTPGPFLPALPNGMPQPLTFPTPPTVVPLPGTQPAGESTAKPEDSQSPPP